MSGVARSVPEHPEPEDYCELCGSTEEDLMLGPIWPDPTKEPRTGTRCADTYGCRERRLEQARKAREVRNG